MKTLIALAFYAIASFLVGVVVCGLLVRFKKRAALAIAAVVFFGGPLAAFIWIEIRSSLDRHEFKKDVAYVQELCKKYGGDKIYKTVDNVEGVFQMKARNSDPNKQWRDQFGMVDPWGAFQGDRENMSHLLAKQRIAGTAGYIFYEQLSPDRQHETHQYRRFYLKPTGRMVGERRPYADNKDRPELEEIESPVSTLASRYGYLIEDLTTREMRKHWVAGGRIKIIDLRTKEVLAERTGYFRAAGPGNKMAWAGVKGTAHSCPSSSDLYDFLPSVLRPVAFQSIPQYTNFD